MNLFARLIGKLRGSREDSTKEALTHLVLAAREDAAFRRRLMLVLNLPARHREALVRTAVEEMERNGEPAALRAAFLVLASSEGAGAAARLLDAG